MRRGLVHTLLVVVVAVVGFSTVRTQPSTAEVAVATNSETTSGRTGTLSEACAPNGLSTCISAWVQNEAERVGVLATATAVSDLTVEFNARWCHEAMHALGKFEAHNTAEADIAKTVAAVPGVCQYGFQHGFAIGLADKYGNNSDLMQLLPSMCDGFPRSGQNYSSCIHGIGHAVSTIETTDLLKAASMCSVLGDSQRWCVSGAVMEWGSRSGINTIRTEGVTNLYTTCQQLAANAKDASVLISCLDEMPALVVAASSREDALSWCDTLLVRDEAAHCGLGTGFTLSNEYPVTNDRVIEACGAASTADVIGGCLQGAIEVLYPRAGSSDPELLSGVCSAQSNKTIRELCEAGLKTARDISKTAPVL